MNILFHSMVNFIAGIPIATFRYIGCHIYEEDFEAIIPKTRHPQHFCWKCNNY